MSEKTNKAAYDIPFLRQKMLAHLGKDADAYPHRLEAYFPHVLYKLIAVWGYPEADTYLSGLLVVDRSGRSGFPDDVASELFRLSAIHSMLHLEETKDGWSSVADNGMDNLSGRRASAPKTGSGRSDD
ncbi:MAG: hypothetical protein LBI62_01090 [Candidatus Accumulibacter sp.]|nr:hypothetical protein [Accumulibacter sp.]